MAGGHSAVARDFETIRSRVRGREDLVDEMAGAAAAGLMRAHAMLAAAIAPRDAELSALGLGPAGSGRGAAGTAGGVGGRTQWNRLPAGGASS